MLNSSTSITSTTKSPVVGTITSPVSIEAYSSFSQWKETIGMSPSFNQEIS